MESKQNLTDSQRHISDTDLYIHGKEEFKKITIVFFLFLFLNQSSHSPRGVLGFLLTPLVEYDVSGVRG